MDTYSLLREIADSWVLLAMFIFFASVAIWVFLPSQKQATQDARMIPFRNDVPKKACTKTCETCACNDVATNLRAQADE